jgi:dTMP kinase
LFITFEGIDGSGKSTQAALLHRCLRSSGHETLLTAEPSQGRYGRIIRGLTARLSPMAEARLFALDRRDHSKNVIKPALERGMVVICDRYIHSSLAYQGALNIGAHSIMALNRESLIEPHMVLLIDIPVETALERIRGRPEGDTTAFEKAENLLRVKRRYDQMDDPIIRRVDGSGEITKIHQEILEMVEPRAKALIS